MLIVFLATSPDLGSGIGLAMSIVLFSLWPVSLFGTLFACLSWFVQVRLGGVGSVARMDSAGIHVKGGQAIAWPEVESLFTRRTAGGDLLLCIRPTETTEFIARAPNERQDEMRSNLAAYEAPIFINLSAFWQGSAEDLSARIEALTSGRHRPADHGPGRRGG
ncbi:hypothetical protein [Actinomadura chokoriensis]|uniref:PH domain-containing protein n=1 Tax=Actinomadura chokoriensis TaxID=454156 RepID=A0ABV4R6V6_9ACTN